MISCKDARWLLVTFAFATLAVSVGCKRDPSSARVTLPQGWSLVSADELDGARREQMKLADSARAELATRLMQRVAQVSQADGFSAAVEVCHGEAPKIAAEVAAKHRVAIGRTSSRLRNPSNLAPVWSEALFNEPGEPAIAVGPHGEFGVVHPIVLGELCANCHGAADKLAPGVAEILTQRYPDDRATGYAPGELRGWFWVEVPKSR
ncbi:MAG: DUF3365 domain-containing protein [Bradymonadaceae bacterium]|nr:DUF3365 domain-containing protein [Lujinxingiaceae bacterium]